jgi:lipid-binding SYLF domain-containing protein
MFGIDRRAFLVTAATGSIIAANRRAYAASAAQIDREADAALKALYSTESRARELSQRSKAILVFPRIIKAGLLVGGQSGDGVLRVNGKVDSYYNIAAVSYGLQAGVQSFSYAMFFVTNSALQYLHQSAGWQLGSGPSIVLVDKGVAAGLTTTTLTQDVYAFAFGQRGLMAGLGLEGSKITKITPGA